MSCASDMFGIQNKYDSNKILNVKLLMEISAEVRGENIDDSARIRITLLHAKSRYGKKHFLLYFAIFIVIFFVICLITKKYDQIYCWK